MVGSVGSNSVEIVQRSQSKITYMTMNMWSWCIRFNFLAAILCAAIVGVTDCLVNNYLPTKNSIQQIHDGSSHETRRLPIVVVTKQHSQQKRKIHLYMSEDDSRENEIRRKVIIIFSVILYILF